MLRSDPASQPPLRHPTIEEEEEEEEESTAPAGNTGAALGRLHEEALLLFGGKTGAAAKRRQSMFESYKTEAASLALMAAERVELEAPWSKAQGSRTHAIKASIELLAQARDACGHFFGPRDELAELFDQADEELRALRQHDLENQHQHAHTGTSGASYYQPDDRHDRELQEVMQDEHEDEALTKALALSLEAVLPADMTSALRNYEIFHQLIPGSVTCEQVAASSEGINAWAINPQTARHKAKENSYWGSWGVFDEGGEEEGKGEPVDRCPVRPVHPVHPRGDEEEEQALQRALLASLRVTFGVVDNHDRDRDYDHWAEVEREKLAIGAKVKKAVRAHNTNEAIKALMAVAKEHELQCAAAPRRPASRSLQRHALHAAPAGVTTSSVSSSTACWTQTRSSRCALRTGRGRVSRVRSRWFDALAAWDARLWASGLLFFEPRRRASAALRSQDPVQLCSADVANILHFPRACCSNCTRPRATRRRRNSSCSSSCRILSPTRRTPGCSSARC